MSLKITHKYSTAAGTPPASGDIDVGEIAINAADAELFTKNNAGSIKEFKNSDQVTAEISSAITVATTFTQTGASATPRTVESKLQDVVSVFDFIPESEHAAIKAGTSNYDATAIINAAITACSTAGGGVVIFPTGSYVVKRSIPGSQASSIQVPYNVSLDFQGSTLLLRDNCGFIAVSGTTSGTNMAITADVAVGSRVFTVDSTANVVAGQTYFVRLINNAWDSVETKWGYWVKIVSVDSATQVTVDVPAPEAMTVASTAAANRRLIGFTNRVDGGFIKNVRLLQSTGGNAESGIDLFYPTNFLVENVYAENPGPGAVMMRYGDSCTVRNIHVGESIAQQGQGSKGRVLNFWNCHNCVFENIKGECFQGAAVFAESYSRNCVIRNGEWHNTWLYRKGTAKTLETIFFVGQGSEVSFENNTLYGKGSGAALFDSGGTTSRTTFSDLFLRTDSKIKGGLSLSAWTSGRFVDQFSSVDVKYTDIKIFSRRGTYTNNMSDATYASGFRPPRGIIISGWYYLTDTTGVGNIFVKRGAAAVFISGGSLVAGARTSLPFTLTTYGTDYPWNVPNVQGSYAVYSGTVNPNTFITWEYLYVPVGTEDDTSARIQGVDS